jgi:hypothetical protein
MARHARCTLFQELGRSRELHSEATALAADLRSGRWQLTEALYRLYQDDVRRWSNPGPDGDADDGDALALATSTSSLWTDWQDARREGGSTTGRQSAWAHDRSVLLIRRGTSERLVALVATARFLERRWLADLQPTVERLNLRVALTDIDGHPVSGRPLGFRLASRALAAETGLHGPCTRPRPSAATWPNCPPGAGSCSPGSA